MRLKEDRIDRNQVVSHFCVVKIFDGWGASHIDRPDGEAMAGLPPPWIRRWVRLSRRGAIQIYVYLYLWCVPVTSAPVVRELYSLTDMTCYQCYILDSIYTCVSCIISEIQPDNTSIFTPHYLMLLLSMTPLQMLVSENQNEVMKIRLMVFSLFDTIHKCERETEKWMDRMDVAYIELACQQKLQH